MSVKRCAMWNLVLSVRCGGTDARRGACEMRCNVVQNVVSVIVETSPSIQVHRVTDHLKKI